VDQRELAEQLSALIEEGEAIVARLRSLEADQSSVENLAKLRRRIVAELEAHSAVLKGSGSASPLQASHVQCSNVPFYAALLQLLGSQRGVTAVQKVFAVRPLPLAHLSSLNTIYSPLRTSTPLLSP